MRIGIQMRPSNSWSIESWESGFSQIRQWGYEQVELAANGPGTGEKLDLYHLTTPQIVKLLKCARSLGLGVSGFQCHHGFSVGDLPALHKEIDHVKRMIDAASAGKVPVVHLVTGMAPPYPALPTSSVLPDIRKLTGRTLRDEEYWGAIKDVTLDGRRFEFVVPGTGQIDQRVMVRTLKKVGYDGVLCLELPKDFADRTKIARDFVPYMRCILEEADKS